MLFGPQQRQRGPALGGEDASLRRASGSHGAQPAGELASGYKGESGAAFIAMDVGNFA